MLYPGMDYLVSINKNAEYVLSSSGGPVQVEDGTGYDVATNAFYDKNTPNMDKMMPIMLGGTGGGTLGAGLGMMSARNSGYPLGSMKRRLHSGAKVAIGSLGLGTLGAIIGAMASGAIVPKG